MSGRKQPKPPAILAAAAGRPQFVLR